jgi:hypothetical protein
MGEPPLHILLIEDDDAHAMIVEKGFRSAGARGTIERVRDGVEGIAAQLMLRAGSTCCAAGITHVRHNGFVIDDQQQSHRCSHARPIGV